MKLHFLAIPLAAMPLCRAATTTLAITNFNDFHQYDWSDPSIWSDGVPTAGSVVQMVTQKDAQGFPVDVLVQQSVPAAIASLGVQNFVRLDVFHTSLSVTGGTASSGFLSVTSGTMSLGTFAGFDPVSKTMLAASSGLLVTDGADDVASTLGFRGADIEINEAGFNLFGEFARVIDQDSGLDAFRHFRENRSFLTLDDGFLLAVPGNFLNTASGDITLSLNPSAKQPELRVAGALTNAGSISLLGNSRLTVTGAISTSGAIDSDDAGNLIASATGYVQSGGILDLGIGGLTVQAPTLLFQNSALVTGSGSLAGAVNVASGTISPGHGAGRIDVSGNLTLGAGPRLHLETGGTAPGESDLIAQSGGAVTLGGTLELSLAGGFPSQIQQSDRVVLLTGAAPLGGAFANAASGTRLATTDGAGTFLVEYGPGSPAPASLTISGFQSSAAQETYAQWAARLGLPPGQNQPGADPNGDGISNLEAYFRGIAPLGSVETGGITTATGPGGLTATLAASRTAIGAGAKLETEISTDLATWSPGPVPVLAGSTPTRLIYQATAHADPGGRLFLRFKIVNQP